MKYNNVNSYPIFIFQNEENILNPFNIDNIMNRINNIYISFCTKYNDDINTLFCFLINDSKLNEKRKETICPNEYHILTEYFYTRYNINNFYNIVEKWVNMLMPVRSFCRFNDEKISDYFSNKLNINFSMNVEYDNYFIKQARLVEKVSYYENYINELIGLTNLYYEFKKISHTIKFINYNIKSKCSEDQIKILNEFKEHFEKIDNEKAYQKFDLNKIELCLNTVLGYINQTYKTFKSINVENVANINIDNILKIE